MKRTMQTAVGIMAPKEHWKALNEIDAVSFPHTVDLIIFVCLNFRKFVVKHYAY